MYWEERIQANREARSAEAGEPTSREGVVGWSSASSGLEELLLLVEAEEDRRRIEGS